MGSALLNMAAEVESGAMANDLARAEMRPTTSGTAEELRRQVTERLAAHRSRRGGKTQAPEPERAAADMRSARIAATVAERYARTPSYREVLAAEAERAIQQARAAAEVAALNAQAIAAAQQRLLDTYDEHAREKQAEPCAPLLAVDGVIAEGRGADVDGSVDGSAAGWTAAEEQELWPELVEAEQRERRTEPARTAKAARREESRPASDAVRSAAGAKAVSGLTVRLYEDAGHAGLLSARLTADSRRAGGRGERGYGGEVSEVEAWALDEEIAFRQAPVFEEPAGPPVALPANLIEFPRQLVAARKARPRYAEGPLRDEMEAAAGDGQLRIFEVDPAQISTSVEEAETQQTAQWTSLWLDAPARSAAADEAVSDELNDDVPLAAAVTVLQPASLGRRAAAGAIDGAVAACGLGVFAGLFVAIAGHGLTDDGLAELAQGGLQGRGLGTIGAVSFAFLVAAYHALFFWFSTATPGMRSVRIALCTFEDENPTRAGVRRRMAAGMLSYCSLGMGFAWAAIDEQRLTWHDRMSRMYLRRY